MRISRSMQSYIYFTLFAYLFKFRPTSIYVELRKTLSQFSIPRVVTSIDRVDLRTDDAIYYYIIAKTGFFRIFFRVFFSLSFFSFRIFHRRISMHRFVCRAKVLRWLWKDFVRISIRKSGSREVELTYCILCELSNSATLPCAAVI